MMFPPQKKHLLLLCMFAFNTLVCLNSIYLLEATRAIWVTPQSRYNLFNYSLMVQKAISVYKSSCFFPPHVM